MDPVSAAACAANVVTFLSSLGGPIASALKRRALKRSLERVVFRVTFSFAAANPATCETMAASAEEIALELAVLVGAGRPADSRALSDTWASLGHMSRPDAMRLADEYVKTLHDALLAVDSFGPLLQRGAAVSSAEILRRIEDAEDRRELREIARAYSAAADSYFYAALARMSGNGIDAMRNEYEASSYFEFATLACSWRALSKFAPVRLRFANLVKQRYDEFCLAQEDSNQDQEHLALKALERGCGEFKGLIHESLD